MIDFTKYYIRPITPRADSLEIKAVLCELAINYQDATSELIRVQYERDLQKVKVDKMRHDLKVDAANENIRKGRNFRMTKDQLEAQVEKGLSTEMKKLSSLEGDVKALMAVISMLKFIGNQVNTLSMISASERKFEAAPKQTFEEST